MSEEVKSATTGTATEASTTNNTATTSGTTAATTATTGTAATTGAVATETGAQTTTTETKPYWPADWQKRIAGENEKELKQLSRYASPEDVWKKARSLEQRLSSGELKPTLPKNPKPEELSAWRKDNGIPEKADGYDLKGIEFDEGQKELVGNILKLAHDANMSPDQARAVVKGYLSNEKRVMEQLDAKDEQDRQEALDALNSEYGGTFRRNINLVENLISKFPESIRETFKEAWLPNGTRLFNSPDFIKGLVAIALENNPAGIVAPAGSGDLGKTMVDRYNEIQKYRNEERTKYNKDNKVQEEERQLIDALIRQGLMDDKGNLVERRKAA